LITLLKSRTTRPELPTLLMIDEAAQLGRMNSLVECMTLLRGYGVRCWSFWQSRSQLYDLYGDDAEVILDNCRALQLLGANNHPNAAGLSQLLGDQCSPAELLQLKDDQQIVLTHGGIGHFDHNPIYRQSVVSKRGSSRRAGADRAA